MAWRRLELWAAYAPRHLEAYASCLVEYPVAHRDRRRGHLGPLEACSSRLELPYPDQPDWHQLARANDDVLPAEHRALAVVEISAPRGGHLLHWLGSTGPGDDPVLHNFTFAGSRLSLAAQPRGSNGAQTPRKSQNVAASHPAARAATIRSHVQRQADRVEPWSGGAARRWQGRASRGRRHQEEATTRRRRLRRMYGHRQAHGVSRIQPFGSSLSKSGPLLQVSASASESSTVRVASRRTPGSLASFHLTHVSYAVRVELDYDHLRSHPQPRCPRALKHCRAVYRRLRWCSIQQRLCNILLYL